MSKHKNFEISTQESYLSESALITALNMIDTTTGKNHIVHYAYILHDKDVNKDGTPKEPHWHILIKMDNSYSFEYVAKRFDVPVNMVERIKTRFSYALCYLIHDTEQAKKDNKHLYEDEEVKSNYLWKKEAQATKDDQYYKNRKNEIIELIDCGIIRRYNISDYMSVSEYDKFKKSIDSAFQFREEKISRKTDRNMQCIFIQGDSGFGKTTFAKIWCKKQGLEFYCSSGTNDPLDKYAGQPAIILDDLRPSTYNLSDLLKLLDNNTATAVKSRYRNKVLECDYIIITTTLDINSFFRNVFKEENETVVQLKRRCEYYMKVNKDNIDIHRYSKDVRDYLFVSTIDNPVSEVISQTEKEQEKATDLMDTFEISVDDVITFFCSENTLAS